MKSAFTLKEKCFLIDAILENVVFLVDKHSAVTFGQHTDLGPFFPLCSLGFLKAAVENLQKLRNSAYGF